MPPNLVDLQLLSSSPVLQEEEEDSVLFSHKEQVLVVDNVINDNHVNTNDKTKNEQLLRVAILGCGMMGREHLSYLMAGYTHKARIDVLVDSCAESLQHALQVYQDFSSPKQHDELPTLLSSEQELWDLYHDQLDLLVIATPNYMHTDTLTRWYQQPNLTILLEKPVAVSQEQVQQLRQLQQQEHHTARVWVAMEYRFIPAISKLIQLLDTVGDLKMCTIRENRFPFLHKVNAWNRQRCQTGDTLVEKCCHFFDLMRLITKQEAVPATMRTLVQRGINYQDEEPSSSDVPIIDAAYVTTQFNGGPENTPRQTTKTIGCLELCMYADGSRHQEEIIVTGTKGRLEAYLPENKVYAYRRPSPDEWKEKSLPPPVVHETIYDCSDAQQVHEMQDAGIASFHGGHHYSSTGVEWFKLLQAIDLYKQTGEWKPAVSLEDGIRAVEMGLCATTAIVNEANLKE